MDEDDEEDDDDEDDNQEHLDIAMQAKVTKEIEGILYQYLFIFI